MSSKGQPSVEFEEIGWQRISIEKEALDAVQRQLRTYGIKVRDLDISTYASEFAEFVEQPCYAGEYRSYGGTANHCLLEKALEHFLSFKLINPQPEMTGVDIGSCKSVAPLVLRETPGCTCYEQDLEYPPGIEGTRIGGSADQIPLADQSVDFMTLHCTYEHFEAEADTGFVRECARLLKPNGQVVIAPLYLNSNYVNITGEVDELGRAQITFDDEASYHCIIPEWKNRFGRHYSPESLLRRVLIPCRNLGLQPLCYRVKNWQAVHPELWIRWILVIRQPRLIRVRALFRRAFQTFLAEDQTRPCMKARVIRNSQPINDRSQQMEFNQLRETIQAEVASQNHLTNIRNYNHAMVEELNKSYPIADKAMLDLGASVHGYALEAALTRGVRRYEGIDLDIERHWKSPRVEFLNGTDKVGGLTRMNANRLEFPADTFDCILTISTFEHFLDPARVLLEMYRVLRPGGVALVTFEPIWTSSHGHHLHHFGAISRLVPDWGHLFLDKAQMQRVLATQPWPHGSPLTVEQMLRWIYHDDEVNRLDIRKLKEVFRRSPFDIVWTCDLADEEEAGRKRAVAEYLSPIVRFSADELMTKGLSLFLRKDS